MSRAPLLAATLAAGCGNGSPAPLQSVLTPDIPPRPPVTLAIEMPPVQTDARIDAIRVRQALAACYSAFDANYVAWEDLYEALETLKAE